MLNQYVRNQQNPQQPIVRDATQKLNTTTQTAYQAPKRTYIPSPECMIPKEVVKPKYIPSSDSQVPPPAPQDYSAVDAVMRRVDSVERNAEKMFGLN